MLSHRGLWIVAGASLLAVSGGAIVGTRMRGVPIERTPRPGLEPRANPPDSAAVAATGRIEARRQAEVHAEVPGRIRRYLRAEGDWVREGEAVAVLESGVEEAAVREAEAALRQAESRLARLRTLNRQGVVSDQERDDAQSAFELGRARTEKAAAALRRLTARAPFTGRIFRTFLEAGESAGPQGPPALFVIGDDRTLILRAEVDELDAGRVRVGARAAVRPDAYPGREFSGRVARAAGMLGRRSLASDDPAERADGKVMEVEIVLAADPALKPGMTAQARVEAR